MNAPRKPRPPISHERRVFLLALGAGLPGVIASIVFLWTGNYSAKVTWTVGLLVAGAWLIVAVALRERVIRPLQTLSNMLAALRERDFSLRARMERPDDALGLALLEINLLGDTLRSQRLGAIEASALLRAVMAEIDVAIFAFDAQDQLRLSNRAGERLLGQPFERLLGRTAPEIGLGSMLSESTGTPRVHDAVFPGGSGRWEVRRTTFRQEGRPHTLLVVTDVSKTLREEELLAWQRLVRVLSHEINNSLAPIKSIAGSLQGAIERAALVSEAGDDLRRGLGVIAGRAESLSRFMSSYARLARLPAPRRQSVAVGPWIRRVAALEPRLTVKVVDGPELSIRADGDQLDQALINLVRNAADAALTGCVEITWTADEAAVEVLVRDDGPGLPATSNLFVPFFTTKPDGSGIGLVLSRQIAEAHGGMLTLDNRTDARGCVARLRLPRRGSASMETPRSVPASA